MRSTVESGRVSHVHRTRRRAGLGWAERFVRGSSGWLVVFDLASSGRPTLLLGAEMTSLTVTLFSLLLVSLVSLYRFLSVITFAHF